MDSSIILANINNVVPLDQSEMAFLESVLIPRPFKQGEMIVQSGETARFLVFVNSGYLMSYYTDNEGQEHVIQFASGGWWCGDIYSLSQEIKTQYSTKGLQDGELLLLPLTAQNQLLENSIKFERYFRILFQNALLRQRMRFVESHSQSAEQRYLSFITTYPRLEQYVAQKYIASYLGITLSF